jgi:hypothetical protein
MDNGKISSTYYLPSAGVTWHIKGATDFNNDGQADLIWEDSATGMRAIWYMKNGNLDHSALLPTIPTQWVIVGVAR